ncbi:MAG: aspartate aminotransferase family protein [Chloroflexi bacterium]|nr:aspartate aminotransferase family protein [Chloroflexota bacterium]
MNTVEKYREYVNTSMLTGVVPVVFERAEGATVFGEDGRKYLDCFAGISVTNAGHGNPEVLDAARAQLGRYVHCCSYVYYNKPMADLAEKLARITPGRLKKSFFTSGGAEAMEGAMRMAKTYTGKREFIALQASFHGRTYATLSITGNCARKKRAGPYMPGVSFAPVPYCYRCAFGLEPETCGTRCAEYVEDIIRFDTYNDIAAFVAEPVLGEGGIIVPPEPYFKKVKEVLDRHGILLFIDEVQTGFARTGKMFAIEHYGVEPDIMAMAKGIANGFPLGAFIAPDDIADSFQPGEHLSTFGGNPVSCAAGLASINFLEREKMADQATAKGNRFKEGLNKLRAKHPVIGDVRGKGLMIGVELVKDKAKTPASNEAAAVRKSCLEKGLLIGLGGVLGNVLRIQPPLVIGEAQLEEALAIVDKSLAEL